MALIDLATVKTLLGAASTVEDASLTILLTYADAAVKAYCNRDFEQQTYPNLTAGGFGDAGYYDGNDNRAFCLRQTPVTAIQNLWYDGSGRFDQNPNGSFAASTLLVAGTDYTLRLDGCLPNTTQKCSYSGIVDRVLGYWPASRLYRQGTITATRQPLSGCIKVQYVAGYPAGSVPADLSGACFELLAQMRRTMKRGGDVQSEGLGAYNYAMATTMLNSMPALGSTRQLLARYREVRL